MKGQMVILDLDYFCAPQWDSYDTPPDFFREPELSTELLRSRTVTEMRNVKILEACPSFFTTQPTQNSSHNTTTGVFQRSPLNYKTNESVERF